MGRGGERRGLLEEGDWRSGDNDDDDDDFVSSVGRTSPASVKDAVSRNAIGGEGFVLSASWSDWLLMAMRVERAILDDDLAG